MKIKYFITMAAFAVCLFACSSTKDRNTDPKAVVGFLDFIQDPTIELAKNGFFDALASKGFSEKDSTIKVVYANAQGDIPTLNQSCDLILSENPTLIATNITLSTITAVQRTTKIPIFMMVAPRPDLAGLTDSKGKAPSNLFGVYETLDYIDTAVVLIRQMMPAAKRIGTVYNQAEPQSEDAYNVLKRKCDELNLELISLPVNNSSEAQLVTEAVLNKKVDAFFALPDNVIFAAFETVVASCNTANVPVFTSEAGLVSRGALASFGADFYQWGYDAGLQAAWYLKTMKVTDLKPEIVKKRMRLYNTEVARKFNIQPGEGFTAYTPKR